MHLKQENDYLPDLSELKALVTPDTKMICINNPNNPSGVVYNKETLIRLQKMLEKAEERIGHPIYVLSDEPYRELVYDGCELPFAPDYIKNCIVVYSFSKSLSLSGERIGYMAVSPQIAEYDTMINALVVALCMKSPDRAKESLQLLEEAWNNYQVYLNDEINFIDEEPMFNNPLKRDKEHE